jgi:hypothetical protein
MEWRANAWQPSELLKATSETSLSFTDNTGQVLNVPLPARNLRQLARHGSTNLLATQHELFIAQGNQLQSLGWPITAAIQQFAVSPEGDVFTASALGIHQLSARGWNPIRVSDGLGRIWAAESALGIAFDSKGRLWVACPAGVAVREGSSWRFFEGKDGLPWNEFTGIWPSPTGDVWFSTHRGAIRWDGSDFH